MKGVNEPVGVLLGFPTCHHTKVGRDDAQVWFLMDPTDHAGRIVFRSENTVRKWPLTHGRMCRLISDGSEASVGSLTDWTSVHLVKNLRILSLQHLNWDMVSAADHGGRSGEKKGLLWCVWQKCQILVYDWRFFVPGSGVGVDTAVSIWLFLFTIRDGLFRTNWYSKYDGNYLNIFWIFADNDSSDLLIDGLSEEQTLNRLTSTAPDTNKASIIMIIKCSNNFWTKLHEHEHRNKEPLRHRR